MSAIAKPGAHDVSSTNPFNIIPVEMVKDVTSLTTPAIASLPAKYQLVFSLNDGTTKTLSYSTAALRNTAQTDYRTAFSTAF